MVVLAYGPAVIDHCLETGGFPPSVCLGKGFDVSTDIPQLLSALEVADDLMAKSEGQCKGYIIQKVGFNYNNL